MKKFNQPCLAIRVIDGIGYASRTAIGPHEGAHHGAPVTITKSDTGNLETTYFDLPADLAAKMAGGGVAMGRGLRAEVAELPSGGLKVDGAGASAWQSTWGVPGMRQRLPELSATWLAAVRSAVGLG